MQPDTTTPATPPLATFLRPELPEAALQGLPGRVARELAGATGTDPAAVLVMFLTLFGNVAGAQPHVDFGGAPQPGRLFALVVGDAATGRKGTAYEAVEELLRQVDPDWADTRVLFGVQSPEALIDRASGDADPRLMIVETEFGRLVQVMGRTGSMSAQLRNAYDGRTLQRVLSGRSKSQEARGSHVSMLGMITPGELLRLHKRLRDAGGLESRILYCFSAPPPAEVSPFAEAHDHKRLAEAVREAIAASRAAVMAQTDPISAWLCTERGMQPNAVLAADGEITSGWLRVVRKRLPAVDASLGPFFSRAETHVIRLAAIYALAGQQDMITLDCIDAALALWEFCARSAERIFGIPVGDLPPRVSPSHSARVARYLYDVYPGWASRDEIRSGVLGGNVPAAGVDQILAGLATAGLTEERNTETGGRPRTEYRLLMLSA